jgi:hypothetical protein
MPKRTAQDGETLERELRPADASPAGVEARARRLLARSEGLSSPRRAIVFRVALIESATLLLGHAAPP